MWILPPKHLRNESPLANASDSAASTSLQLLSSRVGLYSPLDDHIDEELARSHSEDTLVRVESYFHKFSKLSRRMWFPLPYGPLSSWSRLERASTCHRKVAIASWGGARATASPIESSWRLYCPVIGSAPVRTGEYNAFPVYPLIVLGKRTTLREWIYAYQLLIQWNHSSPIEVIWEDYHYIWKTFHPSFGVKERLRDGECHVPRRSIRVKQAKQHKNT
ncbi:hypothetical protein LIER_32447 [Lithospermum erythrorhizon]|uniref:Uncharacterized protein n=1 Tax=Lithospermum erythrorhizon TaxID=34254 RepID=A0AAV3RW26_LITER